ncbi:MAG: serine hydrolase domain-containing protein [Pirellulales bacterium]
MNRMISRVASRLRDLPPCLISGLFLLLVMAAPITADERPSEPNRSVSALQSAESIGEFLEQTLRSAERPLPSLVVAVFNTEGKPLVVARGLRKMNSRFPVTADDHYHFGSITKPMTATVIARAVAEGRLRWDQRLSELPGLREIDWNDTLGQVTLEQLLRHRSGLPTDLPEPIWQAIRHTTQSPRQQRLMVARAIAGAVDRHPTGPYPFQYSNTNYILAAVALETAYGEPCESLIAHRLFEPLLMNTCGWGPVGWAGSDPQRLDAEHSDAPELQPWGHDERGTPVAPGPMADNPAALWPGGGAHGSLADLARFGQFHLGRGQHPPGLLSADQLAQLHQPLDDQEYALGWQVVQRDWAGGTVWTHNGTNTLNFAVLWLAPAKNWGVAVATNQGGRHAELACDAVAAEMIKRFLGNGE